MQRMVCQCNKVTEEFTLQFLELYPDMPTEIARGALNIGTRCQGCLYPDSTLVDITFYELITKKFNE